jgi:hypothetical protein
MPGGCSTCPGVVAVPVLTHTRGSETHGAGESGVLGPQMSWYGAASRCVTGHPAAALRCRGQTAQHRAAHLRSRGAGVGTPLPYAAGASRRRADRNSRWVREYLVARSRSGLGTLRSWTSQRVHAQQGDAYDSSLKLVGVLRTVSGPAGLAGVLRMANWLYTAPAKLVEVMSPMQ